MMQPISDSKPTPTLQFRQLAAFAKISNEGLSILREHGKLLRFRIGQTLTAGDEISKNVYWLLEGQCRLLKVEKDKLSTLARLGPGSCIGIASMLRADPCESVTASTEAIAVCVPDDVIISLYEKEDSFRAWCNQTIWPAELADILIRKNKYNAKENIKLIDELGLIIQAAKLIPSNQLKLSLSAEEAKKMTFVAASANSDLAIGDQIDPNQEIPKTRGPFDLRVLSVPNNFINPPNIPGRNEREGEITQNPEIGEASPLLLKSGIDLGQKDGFEHFKLIEAEGDLEETMACFQMIAEQMRLPFRKDAIERVLRDCIRRGQRPNLQLCGKLAASFGLHVATGKLPAALGIRLQVPCMIPWKGSFALGIRSDANGLTLAVPSEGILKIEQEKLQEVFPDGIETLLIERVIDTPEQRFGPSWFMPALERHRRVLTQVLIASFVVQLFGLANPLLIQVIIDKVISQRSLDTLQVLGIGLVVVTILEGVLGSLRTFLFAETTNRIDQRLGAEVIDHLLRLPLGYFDKRPVGELGTRIAELEKIRNFLTGTALTTILDAAFSLIYIVVMALYSWILTLVALAVLPIQVGLTLLGAPLFRRQFRQAAEENAKTQSHLVESLTGIQTVKAQNVEIVSRWKWQEYYSKYIAKTFEKTITGTALSQTSQVLQKLSQLLVLWVGAALVLQGEMTLGQLIAFRIISGYVTQPLLRLSGIWQSVQELKVSFERLADVIDTPVESNESDQAKIPLPPIRGNVVFENLNFTFKPGQPEVLKNINLAFNSGTFVGIVGQSGSGKSTLMKLIPRLYNPSSGRVKVDGYDIDKVELYSLRRQIGIVPQDPLLFSGTVAENIALTNPDADSEEIVRAAKLACAHDFIMELPSGYSTPVGERGGSLSGGQRQRIAIARTLLSNPKLLVMDEATSALDYETERKVCDNLVDNLSDCTVFFITHRLSTIKRADRVIMMHQGAIVEEGTHDSLMSMNGRYFALYRQQEAS